VAITARERLTSMLAAQAQMSASLQLTAKPPKALDLRVKGVGKIALPVTDARARRLRDLGEPARFGRGAQTLTDAQVRDTWQVPTELVSAQWSDGLNLEPELAIVRDELGLPTHTRLVAELHSLLVYEEGQFFLPHQDSEKDDAMVATLVVTLPSAHTGGELVVHHLGEATRYRGLKDRISLVAFYSDCRHEVLPVTSGYRVALTYNLLLHGAGGVPRSDDLTLERAAECLREHFSTRPRHSYLNTTQDPPQRLVFMLDHEYSQRGLDWSRLKGADATSVAMLREAARRAEAECALALTEINQTWDAWEEDDEWGYGDGPLVEEDGRQLRLNDVVQSQTTLTWWNAADGEAGRKVAVDVDADTEVCSLTPTSQLPADESHYEGYMGNYGNTLDRWYRRAAVVIWPKERDFALRAQADPDWALDELVHRAHAEDPAAACRAARGLEPWWASTIAHLERPGRLLEQALEAAEGVDDADTARMLLQPFRLEHLRAEHADGLVRFLAAYGRASTEALVDEWAGRNARWGETSRSAWLLFLPEMVEKLLQYGRSGATVARKLLEVAWQWLVDEMARYLRSRSEAQRRKDLKRIGSPLAAVLQAVAVARAASLRTRILSHVRKGRQELSWGVVSALIDATQFPEQVRDDPVFARLAADQITVLSERLDRPRRMPDDWSMSLGGGACCELCRELADFLADPRERSTEWPLAKSARQHIHVRIEDEELPVTHVTRRTGRPFTLVLTKTARLFQDDERGQIRDRADLDRLRQYWPS